MKKDLYILGNGFDLFLGFKTMYKDFINANNFEKHRNFFQEKLQYIKMIQNKNYIFGGIGPDINKDYLKKINLFLLFLLLSKDDTYESWYQVESKIQKYACFLSLVVNSIKTNPSNFLKAKKAFSNYFINDIKIVEELFKFVLEIKNITTDNYKNKLFEELQEFEKMFGEYIKNECSLDNRNKAFDNIDKIFTAEKMMNKFVILNFNYSTYLKEYLHLDEDTMVNIHGNSDNPIFGIDFEEKEDDELNEAFTLVDLIIIMHYLEKNK